MKKRLLSILLICALFVVMGPLEMFAESDAGADTPITGDEITTEEVSENEADGEEVITEPEQSTEDVATIENENIEEPETALLLSTQASELTITLKENAKTGNSVTLAWTYDGGSPEDGDQITIYKNGSEVKTVDASTSSAIVDGLNTGTKYSFYVAIGDNKSNTVESTTTSVSVPKFRSISSYTSVVLKWDKVTGATKYIITAKGTGINKTATLTNCTWTHSGISANDIINLYNTGSGSKISGNLNGKDRYTYTITACDANGVVLAKSSTTGDIVKTLYYKLTFKAGASLTSHSGGSVKNKFKKGQVVYARGFSNGKYIFDYKCKDGKVRTYYVMKIRVKAAISSHITAIKKSRGKNKNVPVYTAEEAEQYINDRGVTSQTKYLIWANLFSQKEYVFYSSSKGKKKDWKIVSASGYGLNNKKMSALPVSTGRATMPTSTGSTKINRKLKSQHGTPLWNVTKYFSVHGVQKKWPSPGWPESGACVRNQNANATWIYNKIPKYSRVFVH